MPCHDLDIAAPDLLHSAPYLVETLKAVLDVVIDSAERKGCIHGLAMAGKHRAYDASL